MENATVIHGVYANNHFVPNAPPPAIEGPADLIVYAKPQAVAAVGDAPEADHSISIFDVLGKAEVLRSGEDIDAQLEAERAAWEDD